MISSIPGKLERISAQINSNRKEAVSYEHKNYTTEKPMSK